MGGGGGGGWDCVASAASALVLLASASAAVAAPPAPPASTLGWTTEVLTTANGAQCLDGTPPGYHIQHRDPESWSMHLQGGGWCVGEGSCAGRATTALGSSKSYRKDMDSILGSYDGGAHGIFSSDPVVNPDFHNFTKAYIRYCDGGSFSGNVDLPIKVSTKAFKGNMVRPSELPSARIESLSSGRACACSTIAATVSSTRCSIRCSPPGSPRPRPSSSTAAPPAVCPCTSTSTTFARACPRACASWACLSAASSWTRQLGTADLASRHHVSRRGSATI
jgi:hypothetical protein